MYERTIFDREYRNKYFPRAQVMHVGADQTLWYCMAATLSMREDDQAHGGGFVEKWKFFTRANHMVREIPLSSDHRFGVHL